MLGDEERPPLGGRTPGQDLEGVRQFGGQHPGVAGEPAGGVVGGPGGQPHLRGDPAAEVIRVDAAGALVGLLRGRERGDLPGLRRGGRGLDLFEGADPVDALRGVELRAVGPEARDQSGQLGRGEGLSAAAPIAGHVFDYSV